jgi:hypothetical protein
VGQGEDGRGYTKHTSVKRCAAVRHRVEGGTLQTCALYLSSMVLQNTACIAAVPGGACVGPR